MLNRWNNLSLSTRILIGLGLGIFAGLFFGEPAVTVSDPYFDGAGPDRTGCTRCGACMVGCREGSKNTLVKNYLWFAEDGKHREKFLTWLKAVGQGGKDQEAAFKEVAEEAGKYEIGMVQTPSGVARFPGCGSIRRIAPFSTWTTMPQVL